MFLRKVGMCLQVRAPLLSTRTILEVIVTKCVWKDNKHFVLCILFSLCNMTSRCSLFQFWRVWHTRETACLRTKVLPAGFIYSTSGLTSWLLKILLEHSDLDDQILARAPTHTDSAVSQLFTAQRLLYVPRTLTYINSAFLSQIVCWVDMIVRTNIYWK
jgi:hypothetical protein